MIGDNRKQAYVTLASPPKTRGAERRQLAFKSKVSEAA